MFQKIIFLTLFMTGSQLQYAQPPIIKFNRIEDIKEGRELQSLMDKGKTDSIYNRMSDQFKKMIQGKDNFINLSNSLESQLGKELNLLEEASFNEAGMVSYYQISRYEKIPSITKKWVWSDTAIVGLSISPTPQPAETDKKHYTTKTDLWLPFEETWYTAWGGDEPHLNKHVQSQSQRFAFDFLKSENGDVLRDDKREENSDFYTYGARIIAPGKGTIIKVTNTIPDNNLGEKNEEVPAGNHIVIDHENGEFSFLAHFKLGSIKVKEGDEVKPGDFLGLAGNSGRSDVPHLHYHLQTGKEYNEGEGLPIQFENYIENGQEVKNTNPVRGYLVSKIE